MTTASASSAQTVRPLSNRTRQMQRSRAMTVVMLLIVSGPLALTLGVVLRMLSSRSTWRWTPLVLTLTGAVGCVILFVSYADIIANVQAFQHLLLLLVRAALHGTLNMVHARRAGSTGMMLVGATWLRLVVAAPLIASVLASTRVPTAEELERTREAGIARRRDHDIKQAAARAPKAPEMVDGMLVLGAAVGGDLPWARGSWAVYPPTVLARHLVVIGASGSGKTETVLRLAAGARKAYGWRVYYLDCKGDEANAERFRAVMQQAGVGSYRSFPAENYDGWRGNPVALLNRLMAVVDYSEPYYRDVARAVLDLALNVPAGPPRSAAEFLERLDLETLAACYQGRPEITALRTISKTDMHGVYLRYRSFFQATGGTLYGGWAFGDSDAAYLLLRGLELKDQTASLGRYLLEDFAHYVAVRKAAEERVLLIVDEFPAIAFGGAQAATLFELVRSRGAAVIVTAQSYAGLGDGAERILGAAAALLLHQCGDPQELLERAGMTTQYQRRVAYGQRGLVSGSAREYELGEGALTGQSARKVDANWVQTLLTGVCVLIAEGRYQQVCISQTRGQMPPADVHVAALYSVRSVARSSRIPEVSTPFTRNAATSELPDDTPEL